MYRHFIVLIFSLVFAGTALCQDEGRIECGQGTSSVPAWTAPGGAHVVEQLVCGQMVSVTGLERGYVRIQIGDRIGYVDAKYVRMPGSADRRTGDPGDRAATLDRIPAAGEKDLSSQRNSGFDPGRASTRYETAGTFHWVHAFQAGNDAEYLGWNLSFAGNVTENFGLEANVMGNYYNSPVSYYSESFHGILGGPKVSFPAGRVTPFLHFLAGYVHGNARLFGFGGSTNHLALMPGLGLDVDVNRHLAIRAIQADYVALRGEGAWAYKNMRFGGGVVFRF